MKPKELNIDFDAELLKLVNATSPILINHSKYFDYECCSGVSATDFIAMLQKALEDIPEQYRSEARVHIDDDSLEIRMAHLETQDELIARCRKELQDTVARKYNRWLEYQRLKAEFGDA